MGGSTSDGRIGGGGFCCAKSVVGGPACEWVLKDGSAVGGLVAVVGGCVGCGGSVGGGSFLFWWLWPQQFFWLWLFIYLFIRWCWWMWVCAGGGCQHCCS